MIKTKSRDVMPKLVGQLQFDNYAGAGGRPAIRHRSKPDNTLRITPYPIEAFPSSPLWRSWRRRRHKVESVKGDRRGGNTGLDKGLPFLPASLVLTRGALNRWC